MVSAKEAMLAAKDAETTTITRAALEGLVARIPGVTVNWNGGNPILYDRGHHGTDPRDGPATAAALHHAYLRRQGEVMARQPSEADIAAAERLLGGDLEEAWTAYQLNPDVLTADMIRDAVERLKTAGVQPQSAIVHTSALQAVDKRDDTVIQSREIDPLRQEPPR